MISLIIAVPLTEESTPPLYRVGIHASLIEQGYISTMSFIRPQPQSILFDVSLVIPPWPSIMNSASNVNDAEKGIVEQEPFPIPLALPMQPSESSSSSAESSVANLNPPQTSLPRSLAPIGKQEIPRITNEKGKELSKAPALTPARPAQKKSPPKKKVSRWIQFKLWFNTYRSLNTTLSLSLVA